MLKTAEEVDKLQDELASMKPLLEEAVKESVSTMEQISKDTVSYIYINQLINLRGMEGSFLVIRILAFFLNFGYTLIRTPELMVNRSSVRERILYF